MAAAGTHRLQLVRYHRQFVWSVLGIDQKPVEARLGKNFYREAIAQAAPHTDLHLIGPQSMFEHSTNNVISTSFMLMASLTAL